MTSGARRLTSPDGVTHTFDSGSFALELLLSGGPPPWDRYEAWHAPEDVAGWIAGSHLALELPIAKEQVKVGPAELKRLKEFRAVLWRIIPVLADGKPMPGVVAEHGLSPTGNELDIINQAVGPLPRTRLNPTGVKQWQTPITGTQILGAAARELVDLIGTDQVKRLRMCEGADCYLMFHDTSRPGNRRWCSMQRCGNRHKVGTYRTRHHTP
ncbi:CGNR zinc finger domain-containing protein [Streptomyces sp. SID13031]|uniref:CGNR zinc finger domain-containing protein n=1 Tax=Streptomyces sp. SID13031 TaxID=2706046 RepID=UPI0013C79C0E|nr:CGNR zinc finger domain-containing protein [Streptomyces sp. SID13031]NEA37118.1 CGNR zinc finger domain-containing protein [Streptomyces sp. SID13031]